MRKLTIYELLVKQYNRLYSIYYRVKFTNNARQLSIYKLTLNTEKMRLNNLIEVVDRSRFYTRKIPEKYIKMIKHRYFKPLGYIIENGIDVDMFIAMLNKIIEYINSIIEKKMSKTQRWAKVIFIIAGASRSGKYGRGQMRHIEAHMVCFVPESFISVDSNGVVSFKYKEIEERGFDLLGYFIEHTDFDFLLSFYNLHSGVAFASYSNSPSKYVRFYIYDFNYPGKRKERPLVKYFNVGNDVSLPGVKVYSYSHTGGKWWSDVNYEEIIPNIVYFY